MAIAKFARRRRMNFSLLLLSCLMVAVLLRLVDISLANPTEWSGWILLIGCFALFVYAGRKRLSMLPLGRVAIWLQAHLYIGMFCLFVFGMHIEWRFPSGWFENGLAVSFIGTVVTGVIGIFWSRKLPGRITRLGDEVMYDRIPSFAVALNNEAEQLVLESVEKTGSLAVADFYQKSGHYFFGRPRFQWPRLYRAHEPSHKLERELDSLRRYMRDDDSVFADQMCQLVRKKDLLDAHYTLQGALKHWLTVHVVFAAAIIPMVLLHIVLVYGFTSI
ncbi:MAG: hypothetical protein ACI9WC_000150 [Arenicella sp.]|jgi:hypothetical protein